MRQDLDKLTQLSLREHLNSNTCYVEEFEQIFISTQETGNLCVIINLSKKERKTRLNLMLLPNLALPDSPL